MQLPTISPTKIFRSLVETTGFFVNYRASSDLATVSVQPCAARLPTRDPGVAGDVDTCLYHLDLHAGIRHVLVHLPDFRAEIPQVGVENADALTSGWCLGLSFLAADGPRPAFRFATAACRCRHGNWPQGQSPTAACKCCLPSNTCLGHRLSRQL